MEISTKAFVYEPVWNGNRQLPAAERIRSHVVP